MRTIYHLLIILYPVSLDVAVLSFKKFPHLSSLKDCRFSSDQNSSASQGLSLGTCKVITSMFDIYQRKIAEEVQFLHCCYINALPFAFQHAMDQHRNARARTAFFQGYLTFKTLPSPGQGIFHRPGVGSAPRHQNSLPHYPFFPLETHRVAECKG